jgi:hypothetical protein
MFGYVVQHYESYNAPLVIIACMVLVAAVLFSRIDPSRTLLEDEPAPLPAAAGV